VSVPDQGRRHGRVGPFVTFVERVRPNGVIARWESRDHRKHPATTTVGSTWWAPQARGWWIAVLFAIGSLLFAIGTIPAYATAVGGRWDALTFFVGSLFFTTAGFLTYREAVDAGPQGKVGQRRVFVFQPDRIDWWASGIQLVGTLFFNISTGNALRMDLTGKAAHQHVWRPDAFGSICFLVASALAWFEVCHGWLGWRPRSYSWWLTLLNLIGSVAFGVSAVAGYINPDTGQLHNAERSNLGTFIGAVCFLVGAILLLPERTEKPEPERVSVAPSAAQN
jgi:hypothetical protein